MRRADDGLDPATGFINAALLALLAGAAGVMAAWLMIGAIVG